MVAYTSAPVTDPDNLTATVLTNGTITSGWPHGTEVVIDTQVKRIGLQVVGNLGTDGVTLKCLYSFLKEEWKDNATLIKFEFPMGPITDEQFEFVRGWTLEIDAGSVSGAANQTTTQLIRSGGWSVVDTNGNVVEQYAGKISLGTFVDTTDQAYYQRADAGQYTASQDFTLTNPVNEAVEVLKFVNPTTAITGTGTTATATVDNSGGEIAVGDTIFISGATPTTYNGTHVVTGVNTTVSVEFASAETVTATVQGRVYNDWRTFFKIFLREQGKTYSQQQLSDIGVTTLTYQAYRYPLSNITDLKVTNSDGLIAGATVSTASGTGSVVTITTTADHGFKVNDSVIIAGIDPAGYNGTFTITATPTTTTFEYSGTESGAYNSGGTVKGADTDDPYGKITITYLRDANGDRYNVIGAVADTTYAVGDVVQEDNGAGSRWYECTVAGTVTGSTGVAKASWGGTATFVAYTGERQIGTEYYAFDIIIDGDTDTAVFNAGDAVASQIYERVQYEQRLLTDIDDSSGSIIGNTADTLLRFVGDTLITAQGVYIDSFNVNDQNSIEFFDSLNNQRLFPFVATLTLNFNDNLQNDGVAIYRVFFTTLPGGNNYATANATLVDDNSGTDMANTISGSSSITLDFDYDNNTQGGRTANTDAAVTAVALGLNTGQFVSATGTIGRSKTNSISLVAPLERNYENPA